MRRVKWDELSHYRQPSKRKKLPRRAKRSKWEIRNSILFIKMMDEYLQKNGILIKTGKRRYRMRL